ncbi:hypothetical protein JCM19237_5995 [Photobacterium aphoticum]|uniref:Uncharacterized protein n=1 Tax=Photobacterium aphoticum TaxID=754436 RepID=A0A090R636_9GAMM|nr:hypothetical protein JCM19237_5995 [Photobacterium aphoticum]
MAAQIKQQEVEVLLVSLICLNQIDELPPAPWTKTTHSLLVGCWYVLWNNNASDMKVLKKNR